MKTKAFLSLFIFLTVFSGLIVSCSQNEEYIGYSIAEKKAILKDIARQYDVDLTISDESLNSLLLTENFITESHNVCARLRWISSTQFEFIQINDNLYKGIINKVQTRSNTPGVDELNYGGRSSYENQWLDIELSISGTVQECHNRDGNGGDIVTYNGWDSSVECTINKAQGNESWGDYEWEATVSRSYITDETVMNDCAEGTCCIQISFSSNECESIYSKWIEIPFSLSMSR